MEAIFTGSRVYGTPTDEPDLDLVLLANSDEEWNTIMAMATEQNVESYGGGSVSLRFGKLNMIATSCPLAFGVWKDGTEQLKAKRPVTREQAVELFAALHAEAKKKTEPQPVA